METSVDCHVPEICSELNSAYFGDKRISSRLPKIAGPVAENPSASLPSIFPREADLEAVYRFLRNKRVTLERVLAPHYEATSERAQKEGSILVLHDTTEFRFEGEAEREGLGPVQSGQGFFAHVALAITADHRRRPLGVLGVLPVIRKTKPKLTKKGAKSASEIPKGTSSRELYNRPDKESLRWPELVAHVEAQIDGRASVVHVMDREADDYALFCAMVSPCRFVVRLKHNRVIRSDEPGSPARKVQDALEDAAYRFERTVALSARRNDDKAPKARRLHPTRAARVATLLVRATQVTLVRPHDVPTTFPAELVLNVVHVQEVGAPEGEKPVSWVLFTNEAVATKEQIERVVDIYRARWVIEIDQPWCAPREMVYASPLPSPVAPIRDRLPTSDRSTLSPHGGMTTCFGVGARHYADWVRGRATSSAGFAPSASAVPCAAPPAA